MRRLSVRGVDVVLEEAEGVFMPSPNGLFYAEAVDVRSGERVLDIGTGSGVLAVLAAKAGGRVEATDTDPRAIAAARRNAHLNGVEIGFRLGSLFAGLPDRYDVILANLPNEIVPPAHLAGLDGADARVFAGGALGNELILALLDEAWGHMHAGSRLYLPIHTLTDYHATLTAALGRYRLRLVSLSPLKVKSFVTDHLEFYRQLDEAGTIRIFQRDGGWYSYGYIYEASVSLASRSSEPRTPATTCAMRS
jgi:methylase of polypeptide subunit release factors